MITMALERTYVIPLRKEWLKVPLYKRSKKAVTALKQFLAKHMKSEEVKIGKNLNEFIWRHGIKNPPHKVKVIVTKGDDNIVLAELEGFKYEIKTKGEKKKPKATSAVGRLREKLAAREKKETEEKVEEKRAEIVDTKAEKGKEVEKEEIKELEKEKPEVPKEVKQAVKQDTKKDVPKKAPASSQGINRNKRDIKHPEKQ